MTAQWLTEPDEADYAQVHRLIAAVAALGGAVGWLTVPDRAETDAWLDEVLKNGGRVAVIRVDGRIEALGFWARFAAAVLDRNAEIRKVMTHPDRRGGGLARRLVEALVDDARRAGVETVVLDVRGNNHGALRMYESLGFETYGRLPDFIAVGPDRFDRVLLRLDLGRPADLVRYGGRPQGPGHSL